MLQGNSGKHVLLQPCSADTRLPVTGCVSQNTGIYVRAILTRPEVSLPGKYTVVYTGAMTFPEMLKVWGEVTGKQAVYIETTPQECKELWGQGFGEELDLQYQYMANVPDAMIGEPGVLTQSDLGISRLGSVADTFRDLTT